MQNWIKVLYFHDFTSVPANYRKRKFKEFAMRNP